MGTPGYGSLLHWSAALVVILVAPGLKFFAQGMLAVSTGLVGLLVG
jgi:NCS2 family nucleobase:cation symporter-2